MKARNAIQAMYQFLNENGVVGVFLFFFQVTPVHHWQDIVLIDCGSEKPCFQSDLLNLDAFLMIFHCDRDSLRSYAWCDPSPEILTVAVDNHRCRTGSTVEIPKEQVGNSDSFWYLACWFYCICTTSMPGFIGISTKQTTQLKFNFLKIVSSHGQKNIGDANFSWP